MKKAAPRWKMTAARRIVLFVAAAAILAGSGACSGQARTYKVGILQGLTFFEATVAGFKDKLAELGYREGEKITYDVAAMEIDMAGYEAAAKKFVADKVDLIFVFPTEAAIVVKQVTAGTSIPVVFAQAGVEDTGLVNSVREPGGNITGVRFPSPEITLRRFEVLLQVMPTMKRLFVPHLKDYPSVPSQSRALRPAAAQAGVTLEEAGFSSPDELASFLNKRAAQRDIGMDAILCYAEPLGSTPVFMDAIVKFATAQKIPLSNVFMPGDPSSVIDVMIDNNAAGKQAAVLADKILGGTPAGTIPVVTPENVLNIDFRLAGKIGLKIPDNVLRQAVKVIR